LLAQFGALVPFWQQPEDSRALSRRQRDNCLSAQETRLGPEADTPPAQAELAQQGAPKKVRLPSLDSGS